ncbi:MAG: hypothetical protein OXS32_11185, partial [Verrucomicrobiales bacterium]|nr:hypothetical protein [Verrucomicrobiales bacterium]
MATRAEPASLSDRDKAALVRLLSDPDLQVFQSVRRTLLACGMEARPWLRAGLHSNDRLVRQHSWELITQLDRNNADSEFISFCNRGSENLNLEKGVWLLTRTVFPHFNQHEYQSLIDDFAERVRHTCDPQQSHPATLMAINRVLFRGERFRGDKANYYD